MLRFSLPIGFLCSVLLPNAALAQTELTEQLSGILPCRFGAMAYDGARNQLVLTGPQATSDLAGQVATWNRLGWQRRWIDPAIGPRGDNQAAMAYDERRQVVVYHSDEGTFEWNGVDFSLRAGPAAGPIHGGDMVYEPSRGVVMMYGALDVLRQPLRGVWEWDGAAGTWRYRPAPILSPEGRRGHGMAFDRARGELVVYGGQTQSGRRLADFWVYAAGTGLWRQISFNAPPGIRVGATMSWVDAAQQVVLYGGDGGQTDTWVWDGRRWMAVTTTRDPGPRHGAMTADDAGHGELLLYGGQDVGDDATALWAFANGDWRQRFQGQTIQNIRDAALARDPQRNVLVAVTGGYGPAAGDELTWEWEGARWHRVGPGPALARGVRLAWDPIRAATLALVLTASQLQILRWDVRSRTWIPIPSTSTPTSRGGFEFVHEPGSSRMLMFGGWPTASSGPVNELWAWESTTATWSQLRPANNPSPKHYPRFAVDTSRGRVVYVDGARSETWEWDGVNWVQGPSFPARVVRNQMALVYDEVRQRTVFASGDDFTRERALEWDGTSWTDRGQMPVVHRGVSGAFDAVAGRVLLLSQQNSVHLAYRSATWHYGAVAPASIGPLGGGCTASNGRVPWLTVDANARPWLGDTLALRLVAFPTGATPFLITGFSAQRSGALNLPFALGVFGRSDCQLRVSLDVLSPMVVQGSAATLSLVVPNLPSLVGGEYYQQAFVVDPPGRGGIAVGNALRGRIGSR